MVILCSILVLQEFSIMISVMAYFLLMINVLGKNYGPILNFVGSITFINFSKH